jgi:poly(beta-D-mannuronate) C5 epimerase
VVGVVVLGTAGLVVAARQDRPEGGRLAAVSPAPAILPPSPPLALDAPPVTRYAVPAGAVVVAPGGDDHAAGSLARPLRTLREAVRRAAPGSTVVLRTGTYREGIGKLRKRLTIQPYPGEAVWLKGSAVVTAWRRDGAAWRHDDWAPPLCRTCYLRGIVSREAPLAGHPDMAFLDGASLRQVASRAELRSGTFWVDAPARALWLGSDPAGRTVEATTVDRLMQLDPGAEGSVIRGIGVAHYGANQQYGFRGAMVGVNAGRVTLADNAFLWSASSGVAVFKPDVVVEGNVFAHNGLTGLVANRADRLRLVGNTVADNNIERFALTGNAVGAAGMKIAHTRSPYVSDNVFRDNHASGWWCDLGCSDAVVVRNVAAGNAVNGLYYEVSSRALIASNLLRDNRKRGLKVSSSDHVRIWANTFVNNGVALGVYNDPRDVSADGYSARQRQPWLSVGLEVVDNLFASGDSSDQPYIETADYKKPARTTAYQMLARADGNVYVRAPDRKPRVLVRWWQPGRSAVDYTRLEDLRWGTGREQHGVEAAAAVDRMFVAPQLGDYRLAPGALGVGAGLPLPSDIAAAVRVPAGAHPGAGVLAGARG